jgi:hypothetical protein
VTIDELLDTEFSMQNMPYRIFNIGITKAAASVEKNCREGKKPPEDGCMEPKHVVEEEQEI